MLRLYDTNLARDGLAPGKVELSSFQQDLPIYVGRGAPDKPVDVQVALKREGREVMSRRHCKLQYSASQETWVVEDLGALNGVFVNYERIKGKVFLKDGDVLQLGGVAEDIPRLSDLCIRFKFEDVEGKGASGKRKRGASQNGSDSLTSLTASVNAKLQSSTGNATDNASKGHSPDERWKENERLVQSSEGTAELEKLRKENKRMKKEIKDNSKNFDDANEEITSLKTKCTALRKDNKSLRDEKVKQEKADKEKQERLDGVEEEWRVTQDNLETTQRDLEVAESRLKILQPTGKSCVDDSALSAMVECPLCSLPLLDAVVTACSHGFCRLCLEKKVREDVKNIVACACPVCKTNPMGSRTHMYYFRSKHLDDVVSLLTETSEKAKKDFTKRLEVAKVEMEELKLTPDDQHGFMGAELVHDSTKKRMSEASFGETAAARAVEAGGEETASEEQKAGGDEDEDGSDEPREAKSPPPPRCSYCGVDDHDERSCPEQG